MKLLPFSRWHLAQLDFIGSPFASHQTSIDFAALWLAVRVCQTAYPFSLSAPSVPIRAIRGVRKSSARLGPPKKMVMAFGLGFGKSHRRFLLELNKFSIYTRDYSGAPEFITDEDNDAQGPKTPWYLSQVASLVQSGLTLEKAWNFSIGEGLWFLAASAEAKGIKIDILQPSDRKQLAQLGIEA